VKKSCQRIVLTTCACAPRRAETLPLPCTSLGTCLLCTPYVLYAGCTLPIPIPLPRTSRYLPCTCTYGATYVGCTMNRTEYRGRKPICTENTVPQTSHFAVCTERSVPKPKKPRHESLTVYQPLSCTFGPRSIAPFILFAHLLNLHLARHCLSP
jgi:hypothetical protein